MTSATKAAKRALLAGTALLAAACVQPDLVSRFTPAWETVAMDGEGWRSTRQAILVSDCQLHNLYSQPVPDRSLGVEALAGTAIRPPQLDLFAADVLSWILKHGSPEAEVILHLGDALDMACEGELEAFLEVMRDAGKPWFMAPGNHDFYYFGSYEPDDPGLRQAACFRSGAPLAKDRFIRLYVAALLEQKDPGFAALRAALGLADKRSLPGAELAMLLPPSFDWQAPDSAPGVLRAISWNLVPDAPWRSFIVQNVSLARSEAARGGQRALLLDSCQYWRRPELIPNAWQSYPVVLNCGYSGEMQPDQLRKLRSWLEEAPPERGHTLLFHHPFDSLAPRTKASLGWLWRERQVGMVFTGHTHEGYFVHHDLGGEADEIELNLGSTTDWPMEWRVISGHSHPERGQTYMRASRHTLVEALRARGGAFDLAWEVPIGAADDYRSYRQGEPAGSLLFDLGLAHHLTPYWLPQPHVRANAAARETEEKVKDTLLWTYFRLVQTFPTDRGARPPVWPAGCPDDEAVLSKIASVAAYQDETEQEIATKVDFLRELAILERTRRTTDDEKRALFKLSQAAWASRFEKTRGRRLRVEDDLIRIEARGSNGR